MRTKNKLLCLAAALALALGAGCAPAPEWKQPVPEEKRPTFVQGQAYEGEAVWYGMMFHGRATTSGQQFDMNKMTAAHAYLPLGAMVEVIAPQTGKQVLVRINDRHNLDGGQALSLSMAAAKALGVHPQRRFLVRYVWVE